MSWFFTKLRGLYLVMANGAALPEVPTLNFGSSTTGTVGAVYNPAKNRIDITLPLGSPEADPNTYVVRNNHGDITAAELDADQVFANGATFNDVTIGDELTMNGGFITNAATGAPTSGFIRWAATGLHGIWAKSVAAASVRVLEFDPTSATITAGNDANAPLVELRAGPSGLLNFYVDGSLRLSISKTGIGMNGKSPTVSAFTVTGSRSGATVAVLTSLLTALDGSGILVNSTTA
jgi:hypothetical protein